MARILSGADFGVVMPRGYNPNFGADLSAQLLGQAMGAIREEATQTRRLENLQTLEKQRNELLSKAEAEKTRLNLLYTEVDRIKNMDHSPAKRAAIAKLGISEFDAGRDGSEFIEALKFSTPDEFNMNLDRLSTKAGTLAQQVDIVVKQNAKPKAKTTIGQAREDLKNGLITEDDFALISAAPKDKLTSIQQNLIAAGLKPGTKAFQDELLASIRKPVGTTVNVNAGGVKVPAGHRLDPDDPTGMSVIPIRGSKTEKDMATYTAEQTQSATFASRMDKAEDVFSSLSAEGFDPSSIKEHAAGDVPFGNFLRTDKGQKWFQAASDWVRAKLRKESGAVIGPQEMVDEIKLYFPQPGDGPDVIEQKRESRLTAQEGMIGQSQGAYNPGYDEKKTITGADGKASVYYKRDGKWYTE